MSTGNPSRKRKDADPDIIEVYTSNSNHHNHQAKKKHRQRRNNKNNQSNQSSLVLWWPSTESHVALAAEEDMMTVILRWDNERGMLRDQPAFRLRDIQQKCHRNRFRLSQACSLRRHHIQKLNPYKSKEALRLGSVSDINQAARLFEEVIAKFLHQNNVAYYSEKEQKSHFQRNNPGQPQPGTPDFKMKQPVLLKVYSTDTRHHNNNNNTNNNRKRVHEERTIHWLEAKMFYGASTIPPDKKSAVGSILPKVKQYVKLYGEGAIVFSQGCGAKLAQELADVGVTALSCFSPEFDMTELHNQQRTWCGDKNGNILP